MNTWNMETHDELIQHQTSMSSINLRGNISRENMQEDLPPSDLGTKIHWERAYDEEIANFKDHGDVGDVWFGEGITRKMVTWISDNIGPEEGILDVGTGNGVTLIRLKEKGFRKLKGIDYSAQAVELARMVASSTAATGSGEETAEILFEQKDILSGDSCEGSPFKVIIDKVTYDAISLNPDIPFVQSKQLYKKFIETNIEENGFFMLTSCNWTRQELENHFILQEDTAKFEVVHEIPTPSLSFGGTSGRNVTSIVFRYQK